MVLTEDKKIGKGKALSSNENGGGRRRRKLLLFSDFLALVKFLKSITVYTILEFLSEVC